MPSSITPEQRRLLIILTLINFFNYVDRQVIFPLFGSIKHEFGISDFFLGLLGTAFMVVHSLASVPLGILADKYSRKIIISAGVFFWSVVTFLSGLATSFKALLGIRGLVGIGEAAYAPAATALISDNFPHEERAMAQGVFNAGMFLGGTIGAMLGGVVTYYSGNWRLAFFIVAVPGLILAWLATRLKEKKRGIEDDRLLPINMLFKNASYIWVLISGTLITFTAGAYISWGIEFVSRYKGYSLRDTSLYLGTDMLVAGLLGVLIGSFLADRLHRRVTWGRSFVVAFSLIASTPFMFLGLSDAAGHGLFFVYFFFGTLLLSFYHGPVTAVIHDIVPKQMRATAFAVYVLVVHLVGDTTAPAVVGFISDRHDLRFGMQLATLVALMAGLAFLPVVYLISKNHASQDLSEPTKNSDGVI
ncbi:MAG: MFS transporter [Candidatus Liptonbacteria bacterium]